jgi:PAS domain S-box-containing protein
MTGRRKQGGHSLRRKAESKLRDVAEKHLNDDPSDANMAELVHELQVHQVELEIQNEELRRAQEALSTSRQLFADLFHRAPVGYLVLDKIGFVQDVNETLCKLTDLSASKIKGSTVFDLIAEKDREWFIVRYKAIYKHPEGKNIELSLLTSAGETLPVSLNFAIYKHPEADSPGNRPLLLLTVTDISGRLRAEQALQAQNDLFTTIFESSPNILMLVNADGRVEKINRKGSEFSGKPQEKLIGLLWGEVFQCTNSFDGKGCGRDPECEDCPVRTRMQQSLQQNKIILNEEGRLTVRKAAQEVTLDFLISTVPVSIVNEKKVLITIVDITKRKRAEQEIASLSKFPTENPNPVLRMQNDGQIIYANKASQELLEMWGCEVNDYLPEDMRGLISAVVESGKNKSVDIPCNDKVYSIILVPVRETGYVNLYGRDITDRKRAEDELKRSNTELEQFAYVSSHDLQEPLRGIAGLAQLLQQRYQGRLDSRADEYITLIVDGTQRMQTLINDLLAYSRIGRRGELIQTTEAEAALQATLENLKLAIQEHGARVTNDSLPTVQADPTQLIQLFQNLIGNALKFRAERPPQIHVGVADEGQFWQFSVHDNGIGIEPKYFERIFQVFQRLHTRRDYKGTGIGLAICKKIIERHGGRIWIRSEVGQGTTFYFTLPKG